MIDRGDLPAVRVGRRVRVRHSALDAFIAAGMTAPQFAEGDPWVAVSQAATAAMAAVQDQDREALARSIADLSDAAKALEA